MILWYCGHMIICSCKHMMMCSYEHMAIWSCDRMIAWPYGSYDYMTIWSTDHMAIWPHNHRIIRSYDHMNIICPYDHMMRSCDFFMSRHGQGTRNIINSFSGQRPGWETGRLISKFGPRGWERIKKCILNFCRARRDREVFNSLTVIRRWRIYLTLTYWPTHTPR